MSARPLIEIRDLHVHLGESHVLQGVSFTHGATIGFLCAAAMLLAGGVVALVMNRIRHEDLSSGEQAVAAH